MSERNNRVTIFSNGIADFRRVFEVSEPRQIRIPVNADHIGDILASLNVFGPARLVVPPSFTPRNASAGSLSLDDEDLIEQIGKKLRGARLRIHRTAGGEPIQGRLVGTDGEAQGTGGEAIVVRHLVLLTADGMRRVPQAQIGTLEIVDETVRSELDKALARAFESIRPHSTTVNLEVTPRDGGGPLVVQYTVPAAAWKMTYRLRDTPSGMAFDGVCVVDNNTEEDWDDFIVAVVSGEPVTFGTDLAESKVPRRSTIRVVNEFAQGAAEAEPGMARALRTQRLAQRAPEEAVAAMALDAGAGEELFEALEDLDDLEMVAGSDAKDGGDLPSVLVADATTREIGDFSMFEYSEPVTIRAGQSAALPVMGIVLEEASRVLYYRREDNALRPFRAVRFRNETGQHLGRGVCTVTEAGVYAGSAVLPACHRGEEALLCHALETGVRVLTRIEGPRRETVAIRIGDGLSHQTEEAVRIARYEIRSLVTEDHRLLVDHQCAMKGVTLECSVVSVDGQTAPTAPVESLEAGYRFELELPPESTITLEVCERATVERQTRLRRSNLEYALALMGKQIADSDELRRCQTLLTGITDTRAAHQTLEQQRRVAKEEQDRARELLKSNPQNPDWKQDLRRTEDEIRDVTRQRIPAAAAELAQLEAELDGLLGRIACDWARARPTRASEASPT